MNSKAIGSAFERAVCEKLSLWASDYKRRDIFWRSAGSGSRFTRMKADAASMAGDIVAVDESGAPFIQRFVVECKDWESLEWSQLLYRETELLKAWRKVRKEAFSTNRRGLLVCKEHRRPMILILEVEGFSALQPTIRPERRLIKLATFPQHNMVLVDFANFLVDVDFHKLNKLPIHTNE